MMRKTMDIVKKKFGNKVLVGAEVGVSSGIHAVNILKSMPNVKLLYLIDPYFDSPIWTPYKNPHVLEEKKAKTREVMASFNDRIFWVYKEFEVCTKEDISDSLDFVYIDGNHAYEHVKKDIMLAGQFVKKGGVIGGHDIGHLGIDRAVKEFCVAKQIEYHVEPNAKFMINGNKTSQGWDWWLINV